MENPSILRKKPIRQTQNKFYYNSLELQSYVQNSLEDIYHKNNTLNNIFYEDSLEDGSLWIIFTFELISLS